MLTIKKTLTLFLLFFTVIVQAQHKTNLDVFYSLIDSSLQNISQKINIKNQSHCGISIGLPGELNFFNSYLQSKLSTSNPEIEFIFSNEKPDLLFRIEQSVVKYSNLEKQGFFGDYTIERNFFLQGSFLFTNDVAEENFKYTFKDTIFYSEIEEVENAQLQFTQGLKKDSFSINGIWEPIIVLSLAATVIYLFFSVRSK